MFTFKVFVFIITICVAKSETDYETMCKPDYRDEYDNKIDILEYCYNKLCIEKCCGPSELFYLNRTCVLKEKWLQIPVLKTAYNNINILSSRNVNKKLVKTPVFVYNKRNLERCTSEHDIEEKYEISEDGSLWRQDKHTKEWEQIERLTYCIEYKLHKPTIKISVRQIHENPKDTDKIDIFVIVGVTISSFFLLLVLIVYCLLPELRNLSGLVMMAYTFSLLSAFVIKLVISFIIDSPPPGFCKQISPVTYFLFMSSIFWLNVMSFDVWSGIRSFRIKRGSKREEFIRFLWYSLYAWGTPLLITAIVTTLDNIDISYMGITKPPFEDCFHDGKGLDYYFKIPIGILIVINIILFVVTVYNIWTVKHAVRNSNSSKQQTAKFSKYVKLSVMMGVTWCTELIETDKTLWLYILVNIYNIFTGVAIFYLFVCDKKNLASLCRKFNIQNEFTRKLDASKSGNTKSTLLAHSTVKSNTKDQNEDLNLVQNCANEETTSV